MKPGVPMFHRCSRFLSYEFPSRAVWQPHNWGESFEEQCIKRTRGYWGNRVASIEGVFMRLSLQRPKVWAEVPYSLHHMRMSEVRPQFLVLPLHTISGCLSILHEESCLHFHQGSNVCNVEKTEPVMVRNRKGSWSPIGLVGRGDH